MFREVLGLVERAAVGVRCMLVLLHTLILLVVVADMSVFAKSSVSGGKTGKKLLRIIVSQNRYADSRKIMGEFTDAMQAKAGENPWTVVDRDVSANGTPIPHLSEEEAGAGRTSLQDHTEAQKKTFALASELTDELRDAQHVIIATPMHNWGPPSALKAWFDRVINQRTFYSKAEQLTNIPITIIISSGGPYSTLESIMSWDHLRPWLKFVLPKGLGATPEYIKFIDCDPTGRSAEDAYAHARKMFPEALNYPGDSVASEL